MRSSEKDGYMNSQSRQQYFGITTGLFLVLLGAIGTVNLAFSDHVAQRPVLKRLPVAGLPLEAKKSVDDQNEANQPPLNQPQERGSYVNPKENELAGFKPRLPAYYSQLVTPQQRARIYWIQKRYFIELEKLRSKIDKYEVERDKFIHACLTSDQQRRLRQLQGEVN